MSENKRVATKRMGNFDMASAGDRILAFWENYPTGKIQIVRTVDSDGLKVFDTYIWKEKSTWLEAVKSIPAGVDKETAAMIMLDSADVNAPAKQPEGKEAKKDFEKLDTVSAGRALAKLGFLKDGQVASQEELEDRKYYKEYVEDKIEKKADNAILDLNKAKNLQALSAAWLSVDGDAKQVERVVAEKDKLKDIFLKAEAAAVKAKEKAAK